MQPVNPLPARRSGLRGALNLVFAARDDRTILSQTAVAAPLKIVRPFALEDGRVLVQMLALGPGLCGGDSCSIDVTVQAGARAVLVAQSATRLMGMANDEPARQTVRLRVQAGGHLEYYPGLMIPFPDSSFVQRVDVDLEPGARLGFLDTWAMGRTLRHEYLRFRRLSSRTSVHLSGDPVYLDGIDLEPTAANLSGTGVLDGHRYIASGYWYGVAGEPGDAPRCGGVLMALGRSGSEQMYVRALASDGFQLGESLQVAMRVVHADWRVQPIPLQRFTS